MIRTYTELIKIKTFEDRIKYLRVHNTVGEKTFGYNRYMNQIVYHSNEWKALKKKIILRDSNGNYVLDLGCEECPIPEGERIYIHHLNPITVEDIKNHRSCVFDPENLICTTFKTHQIIHYESTLDRIKDYIERKPNDTIPWR